MPAMMPPIFDYAFAAISPCRHDGDAFSFAAFATPLLRHAAAAVLMLPLTLLLMPLFSDDISRHMIRVAIDTALPPLQT